MEPFQVLASTLNIVVARVSVIDGSVLIVSIADSEERAFPLFAVHLNRAGTLIVSANDLNAHSQVSKM